MSPPKISFDKEELKLTLTGFGEGWSLGQVGSLTLFDHAYVQFPSSWSKFKIAAATHVVDTTWRLNSTLLLKSTLEAGVNYTLANGAGGSMSLDTEVVQHILQRRLQSMDLYLNVKLDGSADRDGFDGSAYVGVGLRLKF